MRSAVARVMRGSSAILWRNQIRAYPPSIWREPSQQKEPDLRSPDQSGGSVDAIIGDNVSPLAPARAGTMVLFPAPGSYGKPDAPAPGSASEARPGIHPVTLSGDGACAVPA